MDVVNLILITVHAVVGPTAAGHALLFKRDPRAAFGWIAVCVLFPVAGPLLYFLFGVNRVHTRARELKRRSQSRFFPSYERSEVRIGVPVSSLPVPDEFRELARVSDAVSSQPLTAGNGIEPLHNGEQVYPVMLKAIESAERSVYLATYIFETDETGQRFIDALARTARRGVDVRVMIDGIGEWYSKPRAGKLLRSSGLCVARFLPPKLIPPSLHINLRNHRKILTVDGRIGFTGGMNIGDRHLAERSDNPDRVVDVHFRLEGPVVAQMEEVFLEDWGFVTGQYSTPSAPAAAGHSLCRTIADGPNEDLDKLETILVGAVSLARRRISIMTPYFLPSGELIGALQAAALRGVEVSVILPAKNNLPFVHWATRNMLWQLLRWGVVVYYQPPPFAHTKLFLVDGRYAQIGSANIDSRSLRLNFELAVEVYDEPFTRMLTAHVEAIRAQSRRLSLEDLDGRTLPIRIRDALAWLFSPYL